VTTNAILHAPVGLTCIPKANELMIQSLILQSFSLSHRFKENGSVNQMFQSESEDE
jgi:hypothetical protein